jgi:hypothetical protein
MDCIAIMKGHVKMDQFELKRREAVWKQAQEAAVAADEARVKGELDASKDTQSHFDKLAVLCGGTIALVVPFLSTHGTHLQLHLLARLALICFGISLLSSIGRNYFNVRYTYFVYQRISLNAQKEEQKARLQHVSVAANPVSFQTGQPMSKEWGKEMEESSKEIEALLSKWKKQEDSFLTYWVWLGRVAHSLFTAGMLALVTVSVVNF